MQCRLCPTWRIGMAAPAYWELGPFLIQKAADPLSKDGKPHTDAEASTRRKNPDQAHSPPGSPTLWKTAVASAALHFRLSEALSLPTGTYVGYIMQFDRISPVDLQIWNANSDGFSFVISYQSRSGPGLHGRPGFVASWRPIYQSKCAIRVSGSPFGTLAEAEMPARPCSCT